MAKVASATITILANGSLVVDDTTNFTGKVNFPVTMTDSRSFVNGTTGPGEVNLVARVKDIITAGSPSTEVVHDLDSIEDAAGDTVGFDHVRVEAHHYDVAQAGDTLSVGDASTAPFTQRWMLGTDPRVVIPAEGSFIITRPIDTLGWTVDSSNKNVRLFAGTIAADVEVISFYGGDG